MFHAYSLLYMSLHLHYTLFQTCIGGGGGDKYFKGGPYISAMHTESGGEQIFRWGSIYFNTALKYKFRGVQIFRNIRSGGHLGGPNFS